MSVSSKIKTAVQLKERRLQDLSECLNISPQGVRNKLNRGSFSASDLIKVCDYLGGKLIIEFDDQKVAFQIEDCEN